MAEFPLLPIPTPRRDTRPRGAGGGGNNLDLPSIGRQGRRIGPIFQRLRDSFAEATPGISLRNDPASIAPERALVFEIAGSIGDFYAAVQQIPGLEYLGDEELEFEADEDFAVLDTRRDRAGRAALSCDAGHAGSAGAVAAMGFISGRETGGSRVHTLVQSVRAAPRTACLGSD
jgi:hypothetical protein